MRKTQWTTDTLHEHFVLAFEDLRAQLNERYETQTKANEVAFVAQKTAMETALVAADRAVQTALLSAEKAVTKAEQSAEKRFDSVNEFRKTLSDQATTFMPRLEAEQRVTQVDDKIDQIVARLNLMTGKGVGQASTLAMIIAGSGAAAAVVAIIIK